MKSIGSDEQEIQQFMKKTPQKQTHTHTHTHTRQEGQVRQLTTISGGGLKRMVLHVNPRVNFRLCGKIFLRIDMPGDTFNPRMGNVAERVDPNNCDGLLSLGFSFSFSLSLSLSAPFSTSFLSRWGLSGVGERMLWKVSGRLAQDLTGERCSGDTGFWTSRLHGGSSERLGETQLFFALWTSLALLSSRAAGTFSLPAVSAHAHGDVRCWRVEKNVDDIRVRWRRRSFDVTCRLRSRESHKKVDCC